MSDRRVFLRDIDDDELVVKVLEAYICTWGKALASDQRSEREYDERSARNLPHVLEEMAQVIHDLADRKKRLRDSEYGLQDSGRS